MTKKQFLLGILAAMLAFGFVLAGCPTESDKEEEGLPPYNEPTIGRETVSYTNVPIIGAPFYLYVSSENFAKIGYSGSIYDGKLTLTLGYPKSRSMTPPTVSDFRLFFGDDANKTSTVDVSRATNTAIFDGFTYKSGAGTGFITRLREDTDGDSISEIVYIFVDDDTTLSRGPKTIQITPSKGDPYDVSYRAFSLPLKRGWNLVERDHIVTETDYSVVIKIADKNVPWAWIDPDSLSPSQSPSIVSDLRSRQWIK